MTLLAALLYVSQATGSAHAEQRLAETSGNQLVLADGTLWRERAGTRVAIGWSTGPEPGRVLALAADPAGLTFVAAEGGLFVLGPFVDVLDPVEPEGDVPRGRPTSLHVDAERRVWFATEEGVGVLEARYFSGRRLTGEDFECEQAYRLGSTADGKLELDCGGQKRVHDPDAGPAPSLTSVLIDGQEVANGAELERNSGGELTIELSGAAAGGATFRYRIDGHHVWRTLAPGARIRVPNPGSRTLEFVAEDEDLDRSQPHMVRLSVAYPFYYSGRFVVAAALGAAVLLSVLFALRMRDGAGRPQPVRAFVSAALVLALGLQVVAGLVPHAKGWPFVGFGMYTKQSQRDGLVYAEHVVMLRPDGRETVVLLQSAGVVVDEPWEVIRPLIDRGEPALRAYLEAWRKRNPGQAVAGLQVQAQRSRLTAHGPVTVAPLVLAHYREAAGG